MKTAVNNYIGSLNWGYRVALRDKHVQYVNAYAEFIEPHKIKVNGSSCLLLKGQFYTFIPCVLVVSADISKLY